MTTQKIKPARWRVERTGAPRGLGYGRGWLAMSDNGTGIHCKTFAEALEYANREARTEFVRWQLALAGVAEDAVERMLMQSVHESRSSRRAARA